jgi:SanA protein
LIVYFYGQGSQFESADLIVVLGCGNRTEKPLLNDRLEKAIQLHHKNPTMPILLTGDETNKSEISCMSQYLKLKIPTATIITDPNSLITWDSFIYIKNNFFESNLLVITNEFHQRRALFFARLLRLRAESSGADIDFSNTWYLFLRERMARLLIYRYFIRN